MDTRVALFRTPQPRYHPEPKPIDGPGPKERIRRLKQQLRDCTYVGTQEQATEQLLGAEKAYARRKAVR